MAKVIDNLNGISVALVMGAVNAGLAMLLSFGVAISGGQAGAVQAFVNALLVAVAAVAHKSATNAEQAHPTPPTPPAV